MIAVRHLMCFVSLCCFWQLQVVAQEYPITYLGIENGLSNNSVVSICEDHNGLMWFGTYDGLNCYNGYEFKVFRNRIGDTNSLLSNTVYAVERDAYHNIWAGGQKGACVYDQSKACFFPLRYKPAKKAQAFPLLDIVHQICSVTPTQVLACTQNLGLLLFENNSRTGLQVPLHTSAGTIADYDVNAMAPDRNRSFSWAFVRKAGLCKYFPQTRQLQVIDPSLKGIICLTVDRTGRLWIGDDAGVYLYNERTRTVSKSYLPERNKVTNISQDQSGVLWISTDGAGVYTLLPDAAIATPYSSISTTPLVKSNSVWSVYEDANGRKWVGTLRGGISMIAASQQHFKQIVFKPANGKENPVANFILSFCEDEKQNVWIGTDGAGIRYWDRSKHTFTSFTHEQGASTGMSSNFITFITRDFKNDIWFSTWFGGINRLNKATGTIERFTLFNPGTGSTEDNTWLVFEDAQKHLWASATNPGCLYLFNRQRNRFELFDARITDLQSITQTRDGLLWGGNYSDLIQIDPMRKKHRLYKINYPVRSLLEDRKKNLWIGTQDGGLLLFDRTTGSYVRYSTTNGLPGNTILRLLEDTAGNIWMSTLNGISRFDQKAKTFRNFSVSDGLQSTQFSYNAGLALSTGEFLFGGINGFNVFHPTRINEQVQQPHLLLTGLTINNVPVEKDSTYVTQRDFENIKSIRLPFNKATVSLDFLNLRFTGTDKVKYAYFLAGWDKAWNDVSLTRKASYSRLQEGHYTFQVKATDSNGEWSRAFTLLTIEVLPPWYRTWWAYIVYVLFVSGIIYIYIRYTRKQERLRYEVRLAHLESEKEKEIAERQLSMFTNISHEFRTPLSLIIDPLKKAIQNKQKGISFFENDLSVALRNARRLLSLVDQLLLFRKADSGADRLNVSLFDVVALCNEVYQCFSQQAKTKAITYVFETGTSSLELYGDYEKLEISLFNLLSNAFKFTPANGEIRVRISENERAVIIDISDTGIGISEGDSNRIFEKFQQASLKDISRSGFGVGLYLVQHFTKQHRGTITYNSRVGQGTTFTLTLQKGKEHLSDHYFIQETAGKSELLEELLEQHTPEDAIAGEAVQPTGGATAEEVITDKKSLLVIEDNEDIRKYLVRLFTSEYLVYSAESGEEGYQIAEKHQPDLIISDITLNGMDGMELCRRIKQSDALNHIPFILLTATTNSESKLKGISDGADDYITKPFDSNLLQARVETLIKSRNQLRKYFLDSITLKENTHKVPAEYQQFLKKCIEVIEANLDKEDFTIKAFSKAMGISHSGLYTKIKAISGQTLNAFIRSIRLRRAAVLMLTENMNVSQASFQVGFEDVRYFREQFSKLFGMPPSEYIKKYRHSFHADLNVIRK